MISSFAGNNHWLSNFEMHPKWPISAFGEKVPSVEHGYQAAKAKWLHARKEILEAGSPKDAKMLGKHVELRDDWDEVKELVMHTLLRRKFAYSRLQVKLLSTLVSKQVLVEGNYWFDTYWGAVEATRANVKRVENTNPDHIKYWVEGDERWCGLNRLGVLLMQVRDELWNLQGL